MSRKRKIIIAVIAAIMIIPFYYSLSHIFTTLPVRAYDQKIDSIEYNKVLSTMEDHRLSQEWYAKNDWRSDVQNINKTFPFPNYSPDGRFYVNMKQLKMFNLWVMVMYRSSDNKRIGSFASHKLDFMGWHNDSSGVYVRRIGIQSGSGFFMTLFYYDFSGPLLVALVPEKEYERGK
ncbi:MAG: hypothetical protein ACYDEQ_07670 [Desulfocucumaceae bacterium]